MGPNTGDSPLFKSIHFGADDVTRLLLEHGAIYDQIDKFGNSIYHITALAGGLDTIKILSNARLANLINPEALNKAGKTAIQIAQERAIQEVDFAEKFEELLGEIQSRDISPGTNIGLDTDVADHRILSAISEWICQARIIAISSNLVRGWIQNTGRNTRIVPGIFLWNSIRLHIALAACLTFAGITYNHPCLASTWAWVKQMMILIWVVAGPGGIEVKEL